MLMYCFIVSGGRSSGIFGQPEAPQTQKKPVPPGGSTSDIFGGTEPNPPYFKSHPNKPKVRPQECQIFVFIIDSEPQKFWKTTTSFQILTPFCFVGQFKCGC